MRNGRNSDGSIPQLGIKKGDGRIYGKDEGIYLLSFPMMFWFVTALLTCIYLSVKYTSAVYYDRSLDPFLRSVEVAAAFTLFGMILFTAFNAGRIIWKTDLFGYTVGTVVTFTASAAFQVIVIKLVKLNISGYDLMAFYGSVAVAEEMLFRAGLQTALARIITLLLPGTPGSGKRGVKSRRGPTGFVGISSDGRKYILPDDGPLDLPEYILEKTEFAEIRPIGKIGPDRKRRLTAEIIAAVISAFLFGLFHAFSKSDPILVLAVTAAGIVMGLSLVIWRDPAVPVTAHVLINIIVTIYGGG